MEAQSTQFQKLYLITASGTVYDSSSLDEVPWAGLYRAGGGDFVMRYVIDKREAWGEYLLYGTWMETPIPYRGEEITGIVALVPVKELEGLIHLESFDGRGTTQVIEQGGEIITASRYYDNANNLNYFSELAEAEFLGGASLTQCRQAIEQGESLYMEYIFQGVRYNAMLKPMGEESYSNGWAPKTARAWAPP